MDIKIKMKRHPAYYLAVAVSLLTFAIYLFSLRNDFVGYDDNTYVLNNPHIRSFDINLFKWAFFDFYAANWHPLTWISHAFDYAVWGLNPMGHHLTNNILHAVNTFLVVVLVVKLMETDSRGEAGPRPKRGRSTESPLQTNPSVAGMTSQLSLSTDNKAVLIAAATTGLLFGLHPIHVESVAWVAERKDLLCALFFLLSIMSYTSYATYRTYTSYLLSLLFFTLALLSKPMAVSLPLVLLILDWYPFERITTFKTFRTAFIEKLPFIILSLVSAILTMFAQKEYGAVQSMEAYSLSSRVLVAANSLITYLWKMILPIDLLPFYPYPGDASLLSFKYLSVIVLAVIITAACIVMVRKQKLLLSVWVYFVATLIPVLGIVQVGGQSMADRYTYLPGLGPFLIAGIITAGIYSKLATSKKDTARLKTGSIAVVSALLAVMSYATLRQIGIWKDGITLWNYVIEKEPLKVPRAYINAGFALLDKGRIDEALELLQIAIQLDPLNANAHHNLGVAYKSKGIYNKAIEAFLTALRLKPDDPETHNNLGVAYKYQGFYDMAIEQHRIALRLKPDYAEAHFNLGIIYLDSGALDKARQEFEAGLKIKPDDQKARQILNSLISQ